MSFPAVLNMLYNAYIPATHYMFLNAIKKWIGPYLFLFTVYINISTNHHVHFCKMDKIRAVDEYKRHVGDETVIILACI